MSNRILIVFAGIALLATQPVQADYADGVAAAQNGDYDTAFAEFSQAAEDGLMMAQFNLAILYFSGRGVDQDFQQAFRWTMAAADQGHVQAQFNVGALYYEGQGVDRDRRQALEWYLRAGNAENAPAQHNAAEMYYFGNGVDQDLVRAHAWASRAVENGLESSVDLLDDIEDDMSDAQLREARRLLARMKIGMDVQ